MPLKTLNACIIDNQCQNRVIIDNNAMIIDNRWDNQCLL